MRGNLVYIYAALRALAQWKPARFTVTVDGERHDVTGYSMGVANSKAYGGGMFVAPQAELDDGKLDVVAKAHVPKGQFLRALPEVLQGHATCRIRASTRGAASRSRSKPDRPFEIYADGDPIGTTPAHDQCRARAACA